MKKKVMFLLIIVAVLLAGSLIIRNYLPLNKTDRSIEAGEPGQPAAAPAKPAPLAVAKKPFDPGDSLMEVNYRHLKFWVNKDKPRMTDAVANQVEEIIMTDKPPKQFEKNNGINTYYLGLKAPGQNGSTGGFTKTSIGVFTSFCVQVPYKPIYRFLVYRADTEQGPWELYTDFIYETPSFPRIGIEVSGDKLVCVDKHLSNKVMHIRKIDRKQH